MNYESNFCYYFSCIVLGFGWTFFSSLSIFVTAFYLPIVFIVIAINIGLGTNMYIYTTICFALVLLHDYLFRIYGGGIHDDAGRGICEIVFYATLITSTITLLINKILDNFKSWELKTANRWNAIKILLDVTFVFALAILTLLFFINFNIVI